MRIDLLDPTRFAEIFQSVTGLSLATAPTGIATDSRECGPGDLFIAIMGEQVDGHRFIAHVEKQGTVAALVSTADPEIKTMQQVVVADPVVTLGAVAQAWRRQFAIPVIGITGTNGKTTTKELLAHLLTAEFSVHVTSANFNTSVGLPLTLLTLTKQHSVSVLEMGANRPGDIALLAEIAEPTHGLITNIAPAHLEGFGNIATVARTKGELFLALSDGTAFVNCSDERVRNLAVLGEQITFGFSPDCDYAADIVSIERRELILIVNGGELYTGSTNPILAKNLLAAVAVADTLGITWDQIQTQIKTFRSPQGRGQVKQVGPYTIIDDTYNANLVSVKVAIDYLSAFNTNGRHVLVFGDMFELGESAAELHRQVGLAASTAALAAVFTVGENTRHTDQAIDRIEYHRHFDNKAELLADLQNYLRAGDVVLVKGSRGMAMETIIEALGKN